MTSIAASVSAPLSKKRSAWDVLGDVEQTRRPVLATAEGKRALEKLKADEALHSTPNGKPLKPASRLHTKDPDDKSPADLIKECKEMLATNDAVRPDWDDLLESDYEEFNSAWKEVETSREAESKQ